MWLSYPNKHTDTDKHFIHPRGIHYIYRVYLALACQILCIARFVWHTSHQVWWWFAHTHRHRHTRSTSMYTLLHVLWPKWFEVVLQSKDERTSERASQTKLSRDNILNDFRITCVSSIHIFKMHIVLFWSDFCLCIVLSCLVNVLSFVKEKKQKSLRNHSERRCFWNGIQRSVCLLSAAWLCTVHVFVCYFERRIKDLFFFQFPKSCHPNTDVYISFMHIFHLILHFCTCRCCSKSLGIVGNTRNWFETVFYPF